MHAAAPAQQPPLPAAPFVSHSSNRTPGRPTNDPHAFPAPPTLPRSFVPPPVHGQLAVRAVCRQPHARTPLAPSSYPCCPCLLFAGPSWPLLRKAAALAGRGPLPRLPNRPRHGRQAGAPFGGPWSLLLCNSSSAPTPPACAVLCCARCLEETARSLPPVPFRVPSGSRPSCCAALLYRPTNPTTPCIPYPLSLCRCRRSPAQILHVIPHTPCPCKSSTAPLGCSVSESEGRAAGGSQAAMHAMGVTFGEGTT